MQLSSPGDHISVVFSIKLLLKLIWLKVSSAFNLGHKWKFPATQLALYTSCSGWLEPAEASENWFNLV